MHATELTTSTFTAANRTQPIPIRDHLLPGESVAFTGQATYRLCLDSNEVGREDIVVTEGDMTLRELYQHHEHSLQRVVFYEAVTTAGEYFAFDFPVAEDCEPPNASPYRPPGLMILKAHRWITLKYCTEREDFMPAYDELETAPIPPVREDFARRLDAALDCALDEVMSPFWDAWS